MEKFIIEVQRGGCGNWERDNIGGGFFTRQAADSIVEILNTHAKMPAGSVAAADVYRATEA